MAKEIREFKANHTSLVGMRFLDVRPLLEREGFGCNESINEEGRAYCVSIDRSRFACRRRVVEFKMATGETDQGHGASSATRWNNQAIVKSLSVACFVNE